MFHLGGKESHAPSSLKDSIESSRMSTPLPIQEVSTEHPTSAPVASIEKGIELLSLSAESSITTSSQMEISTAAVDENPDVEKTAVPEGHQGSSSLVSSTRPLHEPTPEHERDPWELIMHIFFPLTDLFIDIFQLVIECCNLCRCDINVDKLTLRRERLLIVAIIGSIILFPLIILISVFLIVISAVLELNFITYLIIDIILLGCNISWLVFVFAIFKCCQELRSC